MAVEEQTEVRVRTVRPGLIGTVLGLGMEGLSWALGAWLLAIAIELARVFTKGRFPLSAVSIGLGVVLPPESTFAMFVGALIFWLMGLRHKAPGTRKHEIWVEGAEPICAGLISGSALMGIGNAILNVLIG